MSIKNNQKNIILVINQIKFTAYCTEGKNVYTEIKCHSLLPLDDIVQVSLIITV